MRYAGVNTLKLTTRSDSPTTGGKPTGSTHPPLVDRRPPTSSRVQRPASRGVNTCRCPYSGCGVASYGHPALRDRRLSHPESIATPRGRCGAGALGRERIEVHIETNRDRATPASPTRHRLITWAARLIGSGRPPRWARLAGP